MLEIFMGYLLWSSKWGNTYKYAKIDAAFKIVIMICMKDSNLYILEAVIRFCGTLLDMLKPLNEQNVYTCEKLVSSRFAEWYCCLDLLAYFNYYS